jgi:hypothetical protein
MSHGIGTMGADDGYQGVQEPSKLSPEAEEAVALEFQIADLEDQAQNAEDREQLGRASAIRAKIRPLRARVNELSAIIRAAAVRS